MRTSQLCISSIFILVSYSLITGIAFQQVSAANGIPIHNISTGIDYSTIQSAIDDSQTLNGHTITIDEGTYIENVVVSKSISLVGANSNTTIIDGSGNIAAVIRIAANDVTVRGLTVRNATTGILVDKADNTLIVENNAIENLDINESYREIEHGIRVRYSGNCTLDSNIVAENGYSGILFTNSWNFTARNNVIYGNRFGYGLNANDSSGGSFLFNRVLSSFHDGIALATGSSNCLVVGNTLRNSSLIGMSIDSGSENNTLYHNNFYFFNGQVGDTGTSNRWDNGFEGNYWRDYTGTDADNDGIGDTPVVILPSSNADNHPLMGSTTAYSPYKSYRVNVISNSTTENLAFFKSNSTIKMRATNQAYSFFRIQIPHAFMVEPYNIAVENVPPDYVNDSIRDDGNSRWLYFTTSLSVDNHSSISITINGTVTPDVDAPVIDVVSPEARLYRNDSVPLDFMMDETPAWIGYSLDGQANVTIQGNTTLSGLSNIAHSIAVFANDTAGNMGSSYTVVFAVDLPQSSIWLILGIVSIAAIAIVITVMVFLRRRKKAKPET